MIKYAIFDDAGIQLSCAFASAAAAFAHAMHMQFYWRPDYNKLHYIKEI